MRYVDRFTVPVLRRHYPELAAYELTPVDVVDDGERLETFGDGSLDFIIGNHMLEHCENPLGTMRAHLSQGARRGIVYYAVPDKRFSFDADRPLTPWEHLERDDRDGPAESRLGHFEEWARLVNKHEAPGGRSRQRARPAGPELQHPLPRVGRSRVHGLPGPRAGVPGRALHRGTSLANDTEMLAVLRRG